MKTISEIFKHTRINVLLLFAMGSMLCVCMMYFEMPKEAVATVAGGIVGGALTISRELINSGSDDNPVTKTINALDSGTCKCKEKE